jgi:hypothetical protein
MFFTRRLPSHMPEIRLSVLGLVDSDDVERPRLARELESSLHRRRVAEVSHPAAATPHAPLDDVLRSVPAGS